MRRVIFSALLLIIIPLIILFADGYLQGILTDCIGLLEDSADHYKLGEYEISETRINQAYEVWQTKTDLFNLVIDQSEVKIIESGFLVLKESLADAGEFHTQNAILREFLKAKCADLSISWTQIL